MPSKQVEDVYNAMSPEERAQWGKRGKKPGKETHVTMDYDSVIRLAAEQLARNMHLGDARFVSQTNILSGPEGAEVQDVKFTFKER